MPSVSKTILVDRTVTRKYDNGLVTKSTDFQTGEAIDKFWVNTPNYRAVKASSQRLPDNTFRYRRCVGSGGFASFRQESLGLTTSYSRGHWVFPSFPTGTNDYVYYGVQKDLIKKAKGNQWNVPVFVAEGRKTAAMVHDRALHLVSMIVALRKGNFGQFMVRLHPSAKPPSKRQVGNFNRDFGRNPKQAAANAWLEYTYGWVPFVSDVRNAVNTLMDCVDRPKDRIGSVRAVRKQEFQGTTADLHYQDGFNRCWNVNRYTTTLSARATWLFKPGPGDLPARFGLLNPLEVVWELMPYSFVADWFFPIGDYLSSLDAPFRFNHHGGVLGQRSYTLSNTQPQQITGDWKLVGGGGSSSEALGVWRTALTQAPHLDLLKLGFQPEIGAKRAVSAIALLTQAASRLGR